MSRFLPADPDSAAIRSALMAHRDSDYKAFLCPLMPTVEPDRVLGVRTPVLRRMAKELGRNEKARAAFLGQLPHTCFEENQLHAFLLESVPDFQTALAATDALLPFVDNWATCDQLSPAAFRGEFPRLLPHIRRWMADPAPYTCRFGLGMLMRYGLDGDFEPAFLEEAAAPAVTGREHYYVRMMVAWFFATALAKQYESTLPYLTHRRLPPWIHRKTIQKAVESYRVPADRKAFLKSLRD